MLEVLITFLVIGMALPVLPLHVRDDLGFGPITVGVVAGSQFIAALVVRFWSGRMADARGGKRTVVVGFAAAVAAGLTYLASFWVAAPLGAVLLLLLGRAVLGAAESFVMTGAVTWGLGRVGAHHAGQVIAWIGMAMFAGFAAGAPLGSLLYGKGGFAAVALGTAAAPLLAFVLIATLSDSPAAAGRRSNFLGVVRRIWLPGAAAALSSIGFGAIIIFSALLFASRSWTPVWLPFTAYAVALILSRLLFGHLPDRLGGARVAIAFIVIEAAGLALMGLLPVQRWPPRAPRSPASGTRSCFRPLAWRPSGSHLPKAEGLRMGAYTACLDLALGTSGPLLGVVADRTSVSAVFIASALAVLAAAILSAPLLSIKRKIT